MTGQPGARYQFVKDLGTGSFGKVIQAKHTGTGEDVAIKLLERKEVNKYVAYEIQNHSQLRHPHVVQFREVFLTPGHINIVMDFANGGSLFSFVQQKGRLREPMARWFFQQLVLAVDYCHRKGVAMRDIKLENTLLQCIPALPRPLIKVCDFGYSKHDNRSMPKSRVGTITYMAPEVVQNEDGRYDGKKADVWSCGVMLYVMLVGQYPFKAPKNEQGNYGQQMLEMLQRMQTRNYFLPQGLTDGCRELLHRLLAPSPDERATIKEVMGHPWFLADLPSNALNMNDKYLASSRPCAQSAAEIETVVAEAMRTGRRALTDEDIDAAMEAEYR